MLQSLWQLKLSWDEAIPSVLHTKWNSVRVPRQVVSKNSVSVELHGFSDASEVAYGAVVYLRSIDVSNNVTVRILASKSRVAPLRVLTIPRLELCSALLLAQLKDKVKKCIDLKFSLV